MDNPFAADKANPFLTPYQAPAAPDAAPGIKPFTAVDLAPPAGMNGNRHSAPPPAGPNGFAAAPAPAAGPFTGGDFSNAFLGRETPPAPAAPTPASSLAQALAPSPSPSHAAPVVNPFTGKPSSVAPAPADFSPVPERALPAAPAAAERPAMPKPMAAPAASKPALAMTDAPEIAARPAAAKGFLLTTTPSVEGRRVASHLGVVSVEIVIPKDVLFRNPAPYGELHRIKAAEDQLQLVKKKAFEEMSERAKALGADGIVGATLQFSQFDAVVFLCAAVGSAVKFE